MAEAGRPDPMPIPELKAFDCVDHDPIEEWIPESEESVSFHLCLHIGRPEEKGADLFYVHVVTPQAINGQNPGRRLGKHMVVNPYSWSSVREQLQRILERCEGETWDQQATRLTEHFEWEFEKYRP
jgi:hypothetical protein